MKKKRIFNVKKNSRFCYEGRGTVLNVCEFNVYTGEIVVILGNSGAGKSTFIESLGLMSNTLQYKVEHTKPNITDEWSIYKEGEIVNTGEIILYPDDDKKKKIFPNIWDDKCNSVAKVRRENFNFIFQDNNLMHNLKNCDNIILADLIEGSKDYKTSYNDTKLTFESLRIDQYLNDPPNEISGGERQRVAFARGIQPKYHVLFGDEPTGNLDEAASEALMDVVKNNIKESTKCDDCDKAVVIVSHNIPLSLKYADKIVILTKSKGNNHYEILPDHIYVKSYTNSGANGEDFVWINDEETLQINKNIDEKNQSPGSISKMNSADFSVKIKDILNKNVKQKSNNNNHQTHESSWVVKRLTGLGMFFLLLATRILDKVKKSSVSKRDIVNKEFFRLLFEKESEVLAGKMKVGKTDFSVNIWVFSALIFITFLLLGFANGQLNDLKNKLSNDPFVQTIDVVHRGGVMQDKAREFLNDFANDPVSMKYYGISDITEYDRGYLTFIDFKDPSRKNYFKGRSMWYDNPLLDKIVDKDINNACGRKFEGADDISLIVTRDLLKDLHYDEDSPIIFIDVYLPEEDTSYSAPIAIKAVVDQLPGREENYFLYTPNFYNFYSQTDGNFPMQKNQHVKISVDYIKDDKSSFINELKNVLTNELKNEKYKNDFQIISATIQIDSNNYSNNMVYDFIIYCKGGSDDFKKQSEFYNSIITSPTVSQMIEKYDLKNNKTIYQSYFFELDHSSTSDNEEKIGNPGDPEKSHVSFLFEKTDKIREFAKMFNDETRKLDEEYREGLAMDISKVESMYIFNKVSTLTNTMIIFLIIFSIATIFFFVYNLFNMHLHKIRRNIGTLMAFGVNVNYVYRYILFSFVFYCFIIPFLLSIVVGYLLINPFVSFSFFSASGWIAWSIWVTTLAIFIGGFIVYLVADTRYFKKTPSGLIFKSA